MLVALIFGCIVGYILAIPPGPIGMAALRTSMREGWRAAAKLAFGAGLLDVLYCAAAMLASAAITDLFTNGIGPNPLVGLLLQLLIVALMIGFGIAQLRRGPMSPDVPVKPGKATGTLMERLRTHGPFFIGIGYALANLANPTFGPTLVAMATSIHNTNFFQEGTLNDLTFSLGFGVGNVLWLLTLVRLVMRYQHRMTPTFVLRIQQASGGMLILFGVAIGGRIAMSTSWLAIFR